MAGPTTPPAGAPPPGTQRMYDRQGQAVDVPTDQVAQAYKSGQLGFAEGTPVYLRRGGETVAVDGGQAGALLDSDEGRYFDAGSGEQLQAQEEAKEYGGIGKQAKAFAAGAARGLTFGLSDVALAELGGDEAREELRKLHRYGAGAEMLGEGASMLGAALVTGGSSAVARGATAGVRGVAALGASVEAAAGRALVRAGAREGGYLARGLSAAAGQGAEMALYGAGNEMGRQAVANEKLDGEKLFVAARLHALLGGAMGGVVGAGGVALREVASKALDKGAELAGRFGGRESALARGTLDEKAARLVDTVVPGGAEAYAAEKALKSTGGTQKQIGKVLDSSPAVQAQAQEMLERRLPELAGKKPGSIMSRPEMAETIPKLVREQGERIGGALKRLDDAGAQGPSVTKIIEEARLTVLPELKANGFAKAETKAVEDAIDVLRGYEQGKITFQGLHDLSSRLGQKIRGGAPSLEKDALGKVRDLIERELEDAGELAASKLGEAFAGTYRQAKRGYAAAKMLEKALETGANAEAKNATVGLREMLGALSGSNVGSAVGGAIAGPLGGLAGGAVGGLASAYANNLAKRYGDQAAAAFLRHIARGGTVTEAAGLVVDQVVGASVRGFFTKAAQTTGRITRRAGRTGEELAVQAGEERQRERRKKKDDQEAAFKAARERTAALATTPAQVAERLPPGTPPGVAASAQATAARAGTFLRSKLPQPAGQGQTLQPHLAPYEPSPTEQHTFLQYVRAVEDPTSVLRDLERGQISPQGVEAVRAVYPELYAEIQAKAQAEVAQLKTPMTYDQARELSTLLGVVGHPAMDPSFIATIQGSFAPTAPIDAPAPPPAGRPINLSRLYDDDKEAA